MQIDSLNTVVHPVVYIIIVKIADACSVHFSTSFQHYIIVMLLKIELTSIRTVHDIDLLVIKKR